MNEEDCSKQSNDLKPKSNWTLDLKTHIHIALPCGTTSLHYFFFKQRKRIAYNVE